MSPFLGALERAYVYLDGLRLATIEVQPGGGENVYYHHNDHLGTPQKLTDASGAVVWSADYLPFGSADVTMAIIDNNIRFPGQYYDAETGLHYNWHRYYELSTGRYLTPDPIGLAGGINLYTYVNGNPVNEVDPEGLKVQYCTRKFGNKIRLGPLHHAFIKMNGIRWGIQPDGKFHAELKGVGEKCGKPIKCVDEDKLLQLILSTQTSYGGLFSNCQDIPKVLILQSKKEDCCE